MKLTQEPREVVRSNVPTEQTFRIENNAKAFEILSSRIYTNVPLAIVRELSTNAYDAQVDAGNPDRPFDVHLPNFLEPYFSIRDYGTGLSEQNVKEVYTTYFASTRSGSNAFVGALGLGSKSPFAYADQFSIVSYFNGIKYTYSAFKNEEGSPTISLLGTVPSDEHNGLEIRLSIKHSDFTLFSKSAQTVYRHFLIKPNLGIPFDMDMPSPLIAGKYFKLYNNLQDHGSRVRVVMGQVCYNISHDFRTNFNGTLILEVPIGTCSIAANREELHYDKKTTDYLSRAIAAAEAEARKMALDMVDTNDTEINQIKARGQLNSIFNGLFSRDELESHRTGVYSLKEVTIWRNKVHVNQHNTHWIDVGMDISFIVMDVDTLSKANTSALRRFIESNRNGRFYLVKVEDQTACDKVFGPLNTRVSTLPAPVRAKPDPVNRRPPVYVKSLIMAGNRESSSDSWELAEIDNPDVATDCLVIREANKIRLKGNIHRPYDLRPLFRRAGIKWVFGVSENRLAKMKAASGLKLGEELLGEYISDFIAGLTDFNVARHRQCLGSVTYLLDEELRGVSKIYDEMLDFGKSEDIISSEDEYIANMFGLQFPEVKRNYEEEFFQRYPLLKHLECNYYKPIDNSLIKDYIQLIEKNNV